LERTLFDIAIDVSGKTLAQDLGASLQIMTKVPLPDKDLVSRRTERDKRHADDKGNDEPDAKQSHEQSSKARPNAGPKIRSDNWVTSNERRPLPARQAFACD
jgi:hypothetical protein